MTSSLCWSRLFRQQDDTQVFICKRAAYDFAGGPIDFPSLTKALLFSSPSALITDRISEDEVIGSSDEKNRSTLLPEGSPDWSRQLGVVSL